MIELKQLAMLSKRQIEAADEFWKDEGGWASSEIVQLKEAFPKPQDAVRLKAIVLNTLYGTSIFAILRVADCVERVLKTNRSTGPDLVEELVAEIQKSTNRRHYSFAAKYAHFNINPDLPILDSYAEWMVAKHLGQAQSKNPKRYLKFTEDIKTLKQVAGLTCNCEQLDAYLWVAGQYWCWKAHPKTKVSGILKPHFDNFVKDPNHEPTLAILLGQVAKVS
jgi:hypothetical protein